MRRSRLQRAVKLAFVSMREFGHAASLAYENTVAEMAAFDAGVDTGAVRTEDDLAPSKPDGRVGPYGRRDPLDDRSPIIM